MAALTAGGKIVERLLGKGHALAAIASWADNMRVLRPSTANWHLCVYKMAL